MIVHEFMSEIRILKSISYIAANGELHVLESSDSKMYVWLPTKQCYLFSHGQKSKDWVLYETVIDDSNVMKLEFEPPKGAHYGVNDGS